MPFSILIPPKLCASTCISENRTCTNSARSSLRHWFRLTKATRFRVSPSTLSTTRWSTAAHTKWALKAPTEFLTSNSAALTTTSWPRWLRRKPTRMQTNCASPTICSFRTESRKRLICSVRSSSHIKVNWGFSTTICRHTWNSSKTTRKTSSRRERSFASTTTSQLLVGGWCSWQSKTNLTKLTASSTTKIWSH